MKHECARCSDRGCVECVDTLRTAAESLWTRRMAALSNDERLSATDTPTHQRLLSVAVLSVPPDPYARDIATLRAADATPATFADRYKAERLAALHSTRAALDTERRTR